MSNLILAAKARVSLLLVLFLAFFGVENSLLAQTCTGVCSDPPTPCCGNTIDKPLLTVQPNDNSSCATGAGTANVTLYMEFTSFSTVRRLGCQVGVARYKNILQSSCPSGTAAPNAAGWRYQYGADVMCGGTGAAPVPNYNNGNTKYNMAGAYSGAQSAACAAWTATCNDNGCWRVVVYNQCGSEISLHFNLNITFPPDNIYHFNGFGSGYMSNNGISTNYSTDEQNVSNTPTGWSTNWNNKACNTESWTMEAYLGTNLCYATNALGNIRYQWDIDWNSDITPGDYQTTYGTYSGGWYSYYGLFGTTTSFYSNNSQFSMNPGGSTISPGLFYSWPYFTGGGGLNLTSMVPGPGSCTPPNFGYQQRTPVGRHTVRVRGETWRNDLNFGTSQCGTTSQTLEFNIYARPTLRYNIQETRVCENTTTAMVLGLSNMHINLSQLGPNYNGGYREPASRGGVEEYGGEHGIHYMWFVHPNGSYNINTRVMLTTDGGAWNGAQTAVAVQTTNQIDDSVLIFHSAAASPYLRPEPCNDKRLYEVIAYSGPHHANFVPNNGNNYGTTVNNPGLPCGRVSSTAILRVHPRPIITSYTVTPASAAVCAGSPISFKVVIPKPAPAGGCTPTSPPSGNAALRSTDSAFYNGLKYSLYKNSVAPANLVSSTTYSNTTLEHTFTITPAITDNGACYVATVESGQNYTRVWPADGSQIVLPAGNNSQCATPQFPNLLATADPNGNGPAAHSEYNRAAQGATFAQPQGSLPPICDVTTACTPIVVNPSPTVPAATGSMTVCFDGIANEFYQNVQNAVALSPTANTATVGCGAAGAPAGFTLYEWVLGTPASSGGTVVANSTDGTTWTGVVGGYTVPNGTTDALVINLKTANASGALAPLGGACTPINSTAQYYLRILGPAPTNCKGYGTSATITINRAAVIQANPSNPGFVCENDGKEPLNIAFCGAGNVQVEWYAMPPGSAGSGCAQNNNATAANRPSGAFGWYFPGSFPSNGSTYSLNFPSWWNQAWFNGYEIFAEIYSTSAPCIRRRTSCAKVLVGSAPTIVVQPQQTYGCVGYSATFTFVVNGPVGNSTSDPWGYTPFYLEAYQNGNNYYGTFSPDPIWDGISSRVVTFTTQPLTAADDQTNFYFHVYSNCGDVYTATVPVRVYTPPTLADPVDIYVCEGSQGTFQSQITGPGAPNPASLPINYQWYEGKVGGGTAITNWGSGFQGTIPSGNPPYYVNYTTGVVSMADDGKQFYMSACAPQNACCVDNANSAVLHVIPRVKIAVQPIDQTVCDGGTLNINGTVACDIFTGCDLTQYLQIWYQIPAGGSTPNIIDVRNVDGSGVVTAPANAVSMADDGSTYYFEVVYQNPMTGQPVCRVESNHVMLHVIAQPAITAPTANQTINLCLNNVANMGVSATGTNLTYQWYKGVVGNTANPIPGAVNPTYATPATIAGNGPNDASITTAQNADRYWCQVSSGVTACNPVNSPQFTLAVNQNSLNLSFSVEPTDQWVCAGSTKTITGTVTGNTTNLFFDVEKNGTAVSTANAVPATGVITYTIPAASTVYPTNNNDQYQFKVYYNPAGNCPNTLGSAVITLTVYPAPTGGTITTNQTVCLGQTATYGVSVIPATAASGVTYQWYKGATGTTTNLIAGATSSSYTTPATTTGASTASNAVTGDSYWVRITSANGCGTVDVGNPTLTVIEPPIITVQPVGQTLCVDAAGAVVGAVSNLSVTVQGMTNAAAPNNMQYSVYKNGVLVSGPTNVAAASPATITYTPTSPYVDGDSYYFRFFFPSAPALNCGQVTSNAAVIKVNKQATVTAPAAANTTITACVGQTALFGVSATGTNISYQWYKGATIATGVAIPGATNATYTTPTISTAGTGSANTDYLAAADQNVYWVRVTSGTTPACSATPIDKQFTLRAFGNNISITAQPTPSAYNMCSGAPAIPATFGAGSTVVVAYDALVPVTATYTWYKNGTAIAGATGTLTINGSNTIPAPTGLSAPCVGYTDSYYYRVSYAPLSSAGVLACAPGFTQSATITISNNPAVPQPVFTISGNACSSTDQKASVTVTIPAVGATCATGGTKTNTPMTYQWYKNGVAIIGSGDAPSGSIATGNGPFTITYTTPALTAANNGDIYSIDVTYGNGGTCTSPNSVGLSLATLPSPAKVSQQPKAQTVCPGSGATSLQTTVTNNAGAAPTAGQYNYQWYKIPYGGSVTAVGASTPVPTTGIIPSPVTTSVVADSGTKFFVVTSLNAPAPGTCPVSSDSVLLHVLTPPTVSQQPVNAQVCEGDNANFTIRVPFIAGVSSPLPGTRQTPSLPLYWQWYRIPCGGSAPGTPVSLGGNASGSIATRPPGGAAYFEITYSSPATTVTGGNAANGDQFYAVVWSQDVNGVTLCNAQSNTAALSVGPRPTIVAEPNTVIEVCEGQGTTLNVTAVQGAVSSTCPVTTSALTYQWYRIPAGSSATAAIPVAGGVLPPAGPGNHAGGQTATLALTNLTALGASNNNGDSYFLEINNGICRFRTKTYIVRVISATTATIPTVTIVNPTVTVCAGTQASITFRLGANVPGTQTTNDIYYQFDRVAATAGVLTTPITTANSIAIGGGGVNYNGKIVAGTTLPIDISYTTPPTQICPSTYNLYNANHNDQYFINLIAQGQCTGAVTAGGSGLVVKLEVTTPPKITMNPLDTAVCTDGATAVTNAYTLGIAGATTTLCPAPAGGSDNPGAMTVTWYRLASGSGVPVQVATGTLNGTTYTAGTATAGYSTSYAAGTATAPATASNIRLTIPAPTLLPPGIAPGNPGDGDKYYTTITNACGSTSSIPALLRVNQPLRQTVALQNVTVCEGQQAKFCISALGTALTYQWYKGVPPSPLTAVGTLQTATQAQLNSVIGSIIPGETSNCMTIPSAQATDDGKTYYVVVTSTVNCPAATPGPINAVFGPVQLRVDQQPKILVQPSDISVCQGSSFSLSVTASGSTVNYQWYRGGVPIPAPAGTSATYTVGSASAIDSNEYYVIISGGANCGAQPVASSKVKVNVKAPPVIVEQPLSQTMCEGANFTLSVKATGTNLKYQWYKDLVTPTGLISGATTNVLNISATKPTDAGTYYVSIEGDCPPTPIISVGAVINVKARPVAITRSGDTTVCQGSAINLYATVTGANVSVQWYKNGTASANLVPGGVLGAVGSNMVSVLTIASSAATDAGQYFAVITGDCQPAVTVGPIRVTVDTPPMITSTSGTPIEVCEGSSASMSVNATGTQLVYTWEKFNTTANAWMALSGNLSTYTISSTVKSDEGKYRVRVTGKCAGVSQQMVFDVFVYTKPVVLASGKDTAVCEGNSFAFTVTATGSPLAGETNLRFQWKRNGSDIVGATDSTYSMINATSIDQGTYTCEVKGRCGTVTSNAIKVTVSKGVIISKQPQSKQICAGDAVTFDVVSNGTNYQWLKNGVAIPGATNSSYTINVASTSDAGVYTCVITSGCGQIVTNEAVLTVGEVPIIKSGLSDIKVCIGSPFSLSVQVAGNGLEYVWTKNGVVISNTGNSLSVTTATAADAGTYSVTVRSNCGNKTATSTAKVDVIDAPVINAQPFPAEKVVCLSGKTSITVGLTSNVGVSYQWRRNGTNIPGANGATLNLNNITPNDIAEYDVVIVSDCGGQVISNKVKLIQGTSPSITAGLQDKAICLGEELALTATFTGANKFEWRKDGIILNGYTSNRLSITNVNEGDAGRYTVTAIGECPPNATSSCVVTINKPGQLLTGFNDVTACSGDNVSLGVQASGKGIVYQWRKDGKDIPGANAAQLNINPVASGDAGHYECIISNNCGAPIVVSGNVFVNTVPSISTQPSGGTFCEGETMTLSVKANASGIKYQWRRNGVNIPGANSPTYHIDMMASADAGDYDVVISGDCGNASATSSVAKVAVNRIALTSSNALLELRSQIGDSVTGTLKFTNNGNTDINIGAVRAMLSPFRVVSATPSNGLLKKGEQITVVIEYKPVDDGTYTDSLRIDVTSPCSKQIVFVIRGAADGYLAQAGLEIVNISGLAKQLEPVNMIIRYTDDTKNLRNSNLQEITVKVRYNASLLTPADKDLRNSLTFESKNGKQWAVMTLNTKNPYALQTNNSFDKANAGSVVFNIPMYVLLGDSISTPLEFAETPQFIGGKVRPTQFINGRFDLSGVCDKGPIRLTGGGVSITKLAPNPANSSLKVSYETNLTGDAKLVVYTMGGKEVLRKNIVEKVGINANATEILDVSKLESGIYFIEIQQNGVTDKKLLQIVK